MDASQLDAVSAVLGAIAASAGAGAGDAVKDMTKSAITGTRDGLVALVRRRLKKDPLGKARLAVYTAEPTPANGQALHGHLVDAGVGQDRGDRGPRTRTPGRSRAVRAGARVRCSHRDQAGQQQWGHRIDRRPARPSPRHCVGAPGDVGTVPSGRQRVRAAQLRYGNRNRRRHRRQRVVALAEPTRSRDPGRFIRGVYPQPENVGAIPCTDRVLLRPAIVEASPPPMTPKRPAGPKVSRQKNTKGAFGFVGGDHEHHYHFPGTPDPRVAVQASIKATKAGAVLGRPIDQWDPADLGVHDSITVQDESTLTRYLRRDHDKKLRGHLKELKSPSTAPRLVLVVGTSCAGKTRTLYEAVGKVLPKWRLVAPRTDTELARVLLRRDPRAHGGLARRAAETNSPRPATGSPPPTRSASSWRAPGRVDPVRRTIWPTNRNALRRTTRPRGVIRRGRHHQQPAQQCCRGRGARDVHRRRP